MSEGQGPSWAWEGRPDRPAPVGPTPEAPLGTAELRPLSNGQILDHAFRLLRENLATLVMVTAAFSVPVNLLVAFLTRSYVASAGITGVFDDPQGTADATRSLSTSGVVGTAVTILAAAIILPLVSGAVSRIVAAAHVGRTEDLGSALGVVRRRAGALVGAWMLVHLLEVAVGVGLSGAMLLAGIAGFRGDFALVLFVVSLLLGAVAAVVVMARMMAVSPAVVEEGLGPVAAVRRSSGLVKGRTWSVVRLALISGLIAQVLDNVLAVPGQLLGSLVGIESWGWVLVAAGSIMAQLVTTPFIAIVATLAYYDGRVRNEGLDLELMASELMARGTDDADRT